MHLDHTFVSKSMAFEPFLALHCPCFCAFVFLIQPSFVLIVFIISFFLNQISGKNSLFCKNDVLGGISI